MPERRLIDGLAMLRSHDLVAADMLEHRQRVDEPGVDLGARDNPVEHGSCLENESRIEVLEARLRFGEPGSVFVLAPGIEHLPSVYE